MGDPLTATLPLPQNAHTVSVRFGTAPQLGGIQTPVNAIAFNIAKNFDNGVTRFQLRIDPPELGRVDVKLDMSVEGRVQAQIHQEEVIFRHSAVGLRSSSQEISSYSSSH